MNVEGFTISDNENDIKVSKGYYVTKKLIIIISSLVTLVFVSLVLGLVLGLENKYKNTCEQTETQKLESCKESACNDLSFFQSNLIFNAFVRSIEN